MFAHPSTSAIFAQADQGQPGSATFVWDWSLTHSRSMVALASFHSATESLYDFLGWQSPAFVAWTDHLRRFVDATTPR